MPQSLTVESSPRVGAAFRDGASLSAAARYGVALLFAVAAAGAGFILEPEVGAPNLALVFVLPVIGAAASFGWGPALVATLASVLAFDFFFTEPRYSLEIASPADVWTAGLLLVIAAIVSTIAAESRRRELAARQAAEQAQALQTLAHAVIRSAPEAEIVATAAIALNRIFGAPSVIFLQRGRAFRPVARAGGAEITAAEEAAAKGVCDTRLPARADAYPYHRSTFDFWPVEAARGNLCVIGVSFLKAGRSRPAAPDRFIEIVAAYLKIALERG